MTEMNTKDLITELEQMKVRINEILEELKGGRDPDIQVDIERCLKNIGIPVKLKGYRYLVEAIKLELEEDGDTMVCKDIYTELAKKFNTSWNCVEKNIRQSIKDSALYGDKRLISQLFPEGTTITNSRFIKEVANYIKLEVLR